MPRAECSYAENVLWLMRGEAPTELHARALNQSLIVYAENEFNASTFAARVVSSTWADIYAAITAALAAHKGPLHGGANERVMRLLMEIGSPERAESWLRRRWLANKRSWDSGIGFSRRAIRVANT